MIARLQKLAVAFTENDNLVRSSFASRGVAGAAFTSQARFEGTDSAATATASSGIPLLQPQSLVVLEFTRG